MVCCSVFVVANTNHCLQSFTQDKWGPGLGATIRPELFYVFYWNMKRPQAVIFFTWIHPNFCFSETGQELLEAAVWARAYRIWLSHGCCSAIQSPPINTLQKWRPSPSHTPFHGSIYVTPHGCMWSFLLFIALRPSSLCSSAHLAICGVCTALQVHFMGLNQAQLKVNEKLDAN